MMKRATLWVLALSKNVRNWTDWSPTNSVDRNSGKDIAKVCRDAYLQNVIFHIKKAILDIVWSNFSY